MPLHTVAWASVQGDAHAREGSFWVGLKRLSTTSQCLKGKQNCMPVAETQVTFVKVRKEESFLLKLWQKRKNRQRREATAN